MDHGLRVWFFGPEHLELKRDYVAWIIIIVVACIIVLRLRWQDESGYLYMDAYIQRYGLPVPGPVDAEGQVPATDDTGHGHPVTLLPSPRETKRVDFGRFCGSPGIYVIIHRCICVLGRVNLNLCFLPEICENLSTSKENTHTLHWCGTENFIYKTYPHADAKQRNTFVWPYGYIPIYEMRHQVINK